MLTLETISITKFRRCGICRENLRDTDALAIVNERNVSSQAIVAAYCDHHSRDDILLMHPDAMPSDEADIAEGIEFDLLASERDHERSREEYARYQAAGCASQYFRDRDAGYAY